jgi:hypothetical protein
MELAVVRCDRRSIRSAVMVFGGKTPLCGPAVEW